MKRCIISYVNPSLQTQTAETSEKCIIQKWNKLNHIIIWQRKCIAKDNWLSVSKIKNRCGKRLMNYLINRQN